MTGWVYVLELNPTACVKVGQTTDLPQRLAAHLASTAMYGVSITRLASFAVGDAARVEVELLAALRKHPSVKAVSGRETFVGITFDAVVKIAKQQARAERRGLHALPVLNDQAEFSATRDHLAVIREVLRKPREELKDVLARMRDHDPETYVSWNQLRLIEELETRGVPVRVLNGYRVVLAADVEGSADIALLDALPPGGAGG